MEQLPAAVNGTEREPDRQHLDDFQFHEDARGEVVGIGCPNGQWVPVEAGPKAEVINCRFSNPLRWSPRVIALAVQVLKKRR